MPGQHIWLIKVRRLGNPEPQAAESQVGHGSGPAPGDVIEVEMADGGGKVRAMVENAINKLQSGDTITYRFIAAELD